MATTEIGAYDVVVEIPGGQRNKYEVDHLTGRIRLDRTLFTSMVYPGDYGFVDGTLGNDGDPLDALIVMEEPTFPGCLVSCRPVAVFEMVDEAGSDDKIICVPAGDPRYERLQTLEDLAEFHRKSLQHFFESYKDIEPGRFVTGGEWRGRDEAVALIKEAQQRAEGAG
jgi:inorganic pyrophosphatase